jgi:hypothetical protein
VEPFSPFRFVTGKKGGGPPASFFCQILDPAYHR